MRVEGQMHERDYRQLVVVGWGRVAFGADSADSVGERAMRHFEEVAELMQALDIDEEHLHGLLR